MNIKKLTLSVDQIIDLIQVDGDQRSIVINAFRAALSDPGSLNIDDCTDLGDTANNLINAVVDRRQRNARLSEARSRRRRQRQCAEQARSVASHYNEIEKVVNPDDVGSPLSRAAIRAFGSNPVGGDDAETTTLFFVNYQPAEFNNARLLWLKDNFVTTVNAAMKALEAQPGDVLGKSIAVHFYNYAILANTYLESLYGKASEYFKSSDPRPDHIIVPIQPFRLPHV